MRKYICKKGLSDEAHFAPSFAITALHKVETEALDILKKELQIRPQLYSRYINDVCVGPFDRKDSNFDNIVRV